MMADSQCHESDDLQDAPFRWLQMRCYWQAVESFEELISQTKLKLNTVQGDEYNETLRILGKFRRGLAEALWHMSIPQDALKLIQLCISENCHEFSEESMNYWAIRADVWDLLTGDKQSAIIGYEIACHFIPPHDVLKRSQLLSRMLTMCTDAGNVQSFQNKAAELLSEAFQMKVCESQEIVKIWKDCGKKLMSCKAFAKMSIECFTLAQTFLPSNDSKLEANISYFRATAILTANESNQFGQAIKDANTYVQQCPTTVKGYRLLWQCYLWAHNYDDALAAFKNAQEILTDKEEDKYKEFFQFFRTAISQKAFEIFKAGCPVPKCFVQKLISESVASRDVQNLSVLFREGWAAECDASCVPLEMVLESDVKNSEELVTILLKHKARAEGLPDSSKSPLSVCLEMDKLDLAVILLQNGANESDLVQRSGEKPFHASLRIGLKKENLAIFQFFLDSKRYHIDLQDKDGNTLLHFLCGGKIDPKKEEAMIIVLKAGANPSISNKQMKTPIDIASNLRDNRRNLVLGSDKESFNNPPSNDQKIAKREIKSRFDAEAKGEKISPKQSKTSLSSSSSETPSSSKSANSRKEPLSDVYKRIQSRIKTLDVHAWFQKVASHNKPRKVSTKTEISDLQNDQKQGDVLEGASGVAQENEGTSNRGNDDDDAVVCDRLEEAFRGLPWEVEFTAKVPKIIHDRRLEQWKRKLFLEKVTNLAQGRDNWTVHLCKRLEGLPKIHGMLLYETRLTDAARIIWECAVAFSPRYSDEDSESRTTIYSEIIRIWDIVFDHDKIPHAIKNIVTSFTRGQDCILKKELRGLPRLDASQNQGPNLYVKQSQTNVPPFSSASEVQEDETVTDEAYDDQVTFFPPASHHDNEYQVLKFYHLSPVMIRTILKQQPCNVEIDFPFRVTEEEHAIINFEPSPQSSIILIGRSGTGKTTCILYRLWKDFLKYWKKAEESGPLLPKRIVFLPKDNSDSNSSNFEEDFADGARQQSDETQNSAESGRAQGDECEAAASRTAEPVVSAGSESEESLEHLHQLFVTKNGVLCQEIQKNFKGLSQVCTFIKHESEQGKAPLKLQEVEDSATGWPLFLNARDLYVTLDASLPEPYFFPRNEDGSLETRVQDWGEEHNQLSTIPIIEGDEDAEDEDAEDDTDEEDEDQTTEGDAFNYEQRQSMVFVSYSTFENQLWPKMCKKKKRVDFHPSLVWMEIRSFIKGSYEALHTKSGHLNLESYQEIGLKRAPNFTADREAIYKFFLSYDRVKRSSNMFDENDLVFHLYQRVRQCRFPDWSIHNLYVDETQDFTQAELMLLIRCCRDPNGIFLTGDTAQSVMRGISFRFEDLRSLFFYLNESYKAVGIQAEVLVPQIMPLVYNYRSHSGILNLASSVVSLLQEYFPESFDKLAKDQGQLDGPKPVLLGSCSKMDLALLLRGNKRKTTTIEFGAHQVILVASNEARERLPEELSHALVLTIYEAKGLEFDDVLVYNFFKDSQARTEWRIVTQYLLEVLHSERVDKAKVKSRPLSFNPDKHKILNSELKQLYTAVTRARAKVWFFDEDEENRRPVFEYFEQLGLADVVTLQAGTEESSDSAQSLENMFSRESSVEEWEKQGTFFYSKKLWKVAEKCFTISSNVEMSQRCKAYVQADYARSLHSEPRRLKDEFLRAADQFLQCNMIQEARVCLYNARERALYASLLQKLGEDKTAAKWFEKGGNFLEASQCLEKLGDYKEAVEVLVRGNLYQKAINVLKRFNSLSPVTRQQTLEPRRTLQELYLASAELHSNAGNMEKMKNSLHHVQPVDVRVQLLKKHNLVVDAAKELLRDGRGVEAAKIMRENGSFLVAAEYAQGSGDLRLAADCIFAYVRSSRDMSKEDQIKQLEEAEKLYRKAKWMNSVGEVLLQQARLSQNRWKVDEAVRTFRNVQNTCGELECVELLWELAGDKHGVPGVNAWIAIKMVKTVLQLIKSLNASNLNVMTQKQVERCEEHFGLYREGDPSKRLVRLKEGDRFLSFAQGIQKRPAPGNKWEVDLYDAHERIAEVLFCTVAKLIQHVRRFLHNTFATHETCKRYLVGLPCKAKRCQYQDNLPSQDSTNKLFGAILDEICLDAQANDFHRTKKQFGNKNARIFQGQLESLDKDAFPSDTFASCEKLLAFIFPANGQTSSIRLQSCISQLRDKKRGFLKRRLFKFAEELSEKRAPRKEIFSSADLFLAVSQILQLIGSPRKIKLWINDADKRFGKTCDIQKNKPIRSIPVGTALEGDTRVTWFSRWWEDSKFHLHGHGDILKAGDIALRHFELMTANQENELPFPSPRNCLDILEYFMCAHLALFARLQQSLKSRYLVCLPASYMSVISFWDKLNSTTTRHVGIYQAALMHQSSPSTIRGVKKFLHDLVSLMLGGCSPHFNLLKRVLNNPFVESGETERTVILVLTLLCNCGQSVPPDSEARLLQNLNTDLSSDVILPERIERCLKQVRQAKGIRDIVVILQDLLHERNEIFSDVHWENVHQRLWWNKVNPNNYARTFYTDVLEKVAQETKDLPAEEVLESGDVEDALMAEFDLQLEEQQPSRDVDHTRNERLEAIEREETFQEESWEEEIAAEEARAKKLLSEQEVVRDPFDNNFRPFVVDSSGCGICNVTFGTDEGENSQYSLEDDQRNDPVVSGSAEELIELSHQLVLSSVHLAEGSTHRKKVEQFEAYKKLFREELFPCRLKQDNLLKEAKSLLKAAENQGTFFTLLSSKVDQVERADNVITEVTLRIQQERDWADLESFKKAIVSLGNALKICEEEIQLTKSEEADRKSSLLSFGATALLWNSENEPNIKDSACAHVPGLKKKK